MHFQKFIFPPIVALLLVLLAAGCGQGQKPAETADQEQSAQEPGVERSSEVTLSAVVDAVDYQERTFTLKDETGSSQTFTVKNPAVPLENLKTGDNVTMTIYQKEVSYVADPGEVIPDDASLKAVGQEGESIRIVNAQQMINTVETVDAANRMLTVVGSDGVPLTLRVQDDVKNLDQLKAGDKVVTEITQIIVVSVKK
ncbi:MAG: hypothetical protein HUU32_21095 [Calditrichaceae bacterium]|nr:copper-binding protein [Calditrichia bacterium]NUQ43892.1 hypothetical protein [Calditrichaceae bacterium]